MGCFVIHTNSLFFLISPVVNTYSWYVRGLPDVRCVSTPSVDLVYKILARQWASVSMRDSIPDNNGERWCRDCKAFLPVSCFPIGEKRYCCREHTRSKAFITRKTQYNLDEGSRVAARLHHAAYEDARAVFKHKRVDITQKFIRQLFAGTGQPPLHPHRLVPKDPAMIMQIDNVLLVSSEKRKRLVKIFVELGETAYKEALVVA